MQKNSNEIEPSYLIKGILLLGISVYNAVEEDIIAEWKKIEKERRE